MTHKWLVRILLLCLVVPLAGCSSPAETVPPPSTTSTGPSLEGRLASVVDGFVDVSDVHFKLTRAILITIDGKTVVEKYYKSAPDATSEVASVTKSITATLIGIALGEGKIRSVDQTLAELLPTFTPVMRPEVAQIKLHQILTMTSGLPEDDPKGPLPMKRHLVAETLTQGTAHPSGPSWWTYSSNGSHLLSAILNQATGVSTLAYAREKLFDPLDIKTRPAFEVPYTQENVDAYNRSGFAWLTDHEGLHLGWGMMKLTAADMEKVGRLYLNGGVWRGKQLIPADFAKAATSVQVSAGSGSGSRQYGYQWWVDKINGYEAYGAEGFGGQLIEVVPELKLVAVFSATIDENQPLDTGLWFQLLQAVIPQHS